MKTKYKIFFVFLPVLVTCSLFAQQSLLQSGPMVGFSDMRQVSLWVQTKEPASVKITYSDEKDPGIAYQSNEVKTSARDGFTAHLFADNAEPGKIYNYRLFINNAEVKFSYPLKFQTQKLWQWREDAPDFDFVIGSCAYVNQTQYDRPGKPYGSDYEIFTAINKMDPDFMVWMGDNTYLREPDWNTRAGMIKRYTHTRSLPELQPLLASCSHYAIWDDHDYGPDDSDRGWQFKDTAYDIFKLFWANPSYGINGKAGVMTKFLWGDCEFFMLDDRYYRSPNNRKTGGIEMFGDEQVQWLIDGLVSSNAVFKIIVSGGQLLNPNKAGERFSNYPAEREKLLNLIRQENIKGVVFFTGDIHSSEITKMDRDADYPLYEFTISPFTAGVYKPKEDLNPWRVPGYTTYEHNFGYITVSGSKGSRVLTCIDYNYQGKEMWRYSIKEEEINN